MPFCELNNSLVVVVLQRSWNFNCYCEQCVRVLVVRVLFAGLGLAGLDYKTGIMQLLLRNYCFIL